MKSKEAKILIESLKDRQLAGEHLPCPRCGKDNMDQSAARNAMSRYAEVYICSDCGTDEAIRDYAGSEPIPFRKWAAANGK